MANLRKDGRTASTLITPTKKTGTYKPLGSMAGNVGTTTPKAKPVKAPVTDTWQSKPSDLVKASKMEQSGTAPVKTSFTMEDLK